MNAAYYQDIYLLILIWFFVWGTYFIAAKSRFSLGDKPELTSIYFITAGAATLYIFRDFLPAYFLKLAPAYFISFFIIYFLVNHFYFILRKNFKEPVLLIEKFPLDHWLEANRRAIFMTSAHIFFQQAIITLLILALQKAGFGLGSIIGIFAAVFGAIHLPLVFAKGPYLTALFAFAAINSSYIFPIFLLNFTWGFVFNFAFHWLFYALITFLFWKYQDKIKL